MEKVVELYVRQAMHIADEDLNYGSVADHNFSFPLIAYASAIARSFSKLQLFLRLAAKLRPRNFDQRKIIGKMEP